MKVMKLVVLENKQTLASLKLYIEEMSFDDILVYLPENLCITYTHHAIKCTPMYLTGFVVNKKLKATFTNIAFHNIFAIGTTQASKYLFNKDDSIKV